MTSGSDNKLVGDTDECESNDESPKEINSSRSYGLVVVNESHRFRNSGTAYRTLKSLTQEQRPKVLLLSATPQNNRPEDLRNQIYLFQHEPNNTTLDTIPDRKLDTYFNVVCQTYASLISSYDENKNPKTEEQKKVDLKEDKVLFTEVRERIVNPLVVRRTRTGLIKHYAKDIADQNLTFPVIKDPISIDYKLNEKLATLFFYTLDLITSELSDVRGDELGYYRYSAIEFLKPEYRQFYEKNNLTVSGTSNRLTNIMQTLLVRSLESSFDAFKQSLNDLKRYYKNMVQMFEDDMVFICPDIDVNKELKTENSRFKACINIRVKMNKKGERNREFKLHDFDSEFISNLRKDSILI